MELSLMASHGCPSGLGAVFHQEHHLGRVSEGLHHFLPYDGLNQDIVDPVSFNLSLHQKEESGRSTVGTLDNNRFIRIDSLSKRPNLIDLKTDKHQDSIPLSFGVSEQCNRHEKILKLLKSGSIEQESDLLDLSVLFDIMGHQQIADFDDSQSLNNLIFPTQKLFLNESLLELLGDKSISEEKAYNPEMNDMLTVISEFYSAKNMNRSSKLTMLVPYFERRRRARAKTDTSNLATQKLESLKSQEKVKRKTTQKKRSSKERDVYSNSSLHACETLLSIIADREQQQCKSTFASLKKSGPQLPQLLTQFSASIAGTGIALVLSVLWRVGCSRAPFCGSKVLSTGLGLGLVWLSWAVNKLRNTVISISKSSSTFGDKEEEMMRHLDGNLKDVYFRAAALMALAVLKVV